MQTVLGRAAATDAAELRHLQRVLHAMPAPAWPGLAARGWSRTGARELSGRYLFEDRDTTLAFLADPAAVDPALAVLDTERALSKPDWGSPQPVHGAIEQPVFIVSAPRTGSTMLCDLLARSTQLWSIGGEAHSAIEGIRALHPASRGWESHRLGAADADAATVRALHAFLLAELRDPRGRRYLGMDRDARPRGVRIVEKTPENALRIPFLAAAFPDARFVHLVREPRETISSMIEAWTHTGFVNIPSLPGWDRGRWHLLLPPGWRTLNGRSLAEIAAFQWRAANETILHDLAALSHDRWVVVEYSALVADPRAVVATVCAATGLEIDAGLEAALSKPLPIAATTISHPSPTKWRSRAAMRDARLDGVDDLAARARALAAPSPVAPKRRVGWVRFRCFLDELEPQSNEGTGVEPGLLANPTLRYQHGTTIPGDLLRRARFRERFLADHAIAWVEDPGTQALRPFWLRREHMPIVAQLVPGARADCEVTAAVRALLVRANILTTAHRFLARRRAGLSSADAAASQFACDGYCMLSGLLHEAHLRALARYYRELIGQGSWQLGDEQVPGRYGWHDEPLARFFHHQLAAYVGRVVGESVKPTYAYVSAYQAGAVLERHVDREQCRFTMSLVIEQAPEDGALDWPLCFDTPSGTVAIVQQLGDAVLFKGNDLPHHRPRLPDGRAQTCLLFHYVAADFVGTRH